MKKVLATFFIIILMQFTAAPANAFIMDFPEKILQIVNKVNEKLALIDKKIQEFQSMKSKIKSGVTGSATFNLFKDIQSAYKTVENSVNNVQEASKISVFHGFQEVLTQGDVLSYVEIQYEVKEQLTAKTGAGNDTKILEEKRNQNEEISKNNISTLYAKALAVRYKTELAAKNYKEPKIDFDNETKVLQAIRYVLEETIKRKANILQMEASLLEYYGTENLRNMKIPSVNDLDADVTPEKIISSQEAYQ